MTMESYIPNKTIDVPLPVTFNCMPNAIHRRKCFNVEKQR